MAAGHERIKHSGGEHARDEFDFRYNNRVALGVDDRYRADKALLGVVGKRLTYRTINCGGTATGSKPKAGRPKRSRQRRR